MNSARQETTASGQSMSLCSQQSSDFSPQTPALHKTESNSAVGNLERSHSGRCAAAEFESFGSVRHRPKSNLFRLKPASVHGCSSVGRPGTSAMNLIRPCFVEKPNSLRSAYLKCSPGLSCENSYVFWMAASTKDGHAARKLCVAWSRTSTQSLRTNASAASAGAPAWHRRAASPNTLNSYKGI